MYSIRTGKSKLVNNKLVTEFELYNVVTKKVELVDTDHLRLLAVCRSMNQQVA